VRVEESWLSGHFGGAYAQYRRDVAALIPGLF
jgi:protein-S-isoprenylcysteine O-methyltransferase Ste14